MTFCLYCEFINVLTEIEKHKWKNLHELYRDVRWSKSSFIRTPAFTFCFYILNSSFADILSCILNLSSSFVLAKNEKTF